MKEKQTRKSFQSGQRVYWIYIMHKVYLGKYIKLELCLGLLLLVPQKKAKNTLFAVMTASWLMKNAWT